MEAVSLNVDNTYLNTFQSEKMHEHTSDTSKVQTSLASEQDSRIHNSAVSVSISMESIKVFLNIKSVELSQKNASAQNSLMNIINNTELYSFLSGKELDGGFSLKSIGYDGKPITELSSSEAKDLVSENGFFGITQTSNRVSSFVFGMARDNIEALEEAKKGVMRGFEEAEKMWGGTLPELSYETQERTLKIIDEKISELLKTDVQKELESTEKE